MQLVKVAIAIVAVAFPPSEAAEVASSNSLAASIQDKARAMIALSPSVLEDPIAFTENRCPQSVTKCLNDSACSQEFNGVILRGLNPISPAAQALQQCVSSALFSLRNTLALPGGEKKIENGPVASDGS